MTIEQVQAKIKQLEEQVSSIEKEWIEAGQFQTRLKTKWSRVMTDWDHFDSSIKRCADIGRKLDNARTKLTNMKALLRQMTSPKTVTSTLDDFYAQSCLYLSSHIKVGDSVFATYLDDKNPVVVKRVNKKSVTVYHPHFGDYKYDYIKDGVRLSINGVPMETSEHIRLVKEYYQSLQTKDD